MHVLWRAHALSVFPTPVGVFPTPKCAREFSISLPHARGGVSIVTGAGDGLAQSSPRPWGCFPRSPEAEDTSTVFPTPVGVFPRQQLLNLEAKGLPHARGGVSNFSTLVSRKSMSSPRPWGCFYRDMFGQRLAAVFPTPVGVFLHTVCCWLRLQSLPHARGGVSRASCLRRLFVLSSPRPWGCFLNGASGHIDLCCLPHARGGVSSDSTPFSLRFQSSPRPWGCFQPAAYELP